MADTVLEKSPAYVQDKRAGANARITAFRLWAKHVKPDVQRWVFCFYFRAFLQLIKYKV